MPIHSGFHNGYYKDIIGFMRNLLSGAYKDNKHLEKDAELRQAGVTTIRAIGVAMCGKQAAVEIALL